MTIHQVARVDRGAFNQSWDVLQGREIGPVGVSNIWKIISQDEWHSISPYFMPEELACKGTGNLLVFVPALKAYNTLREEGLLRPHSPTSAHRSPAHNKSVGGSKHSRHLAGSAFDIPRFAIPNVAAFAKRAKELGFNGFGFYSSFIHIDFRARPAQWGRA